MVLRRALYEGSVRLALRFVRPFVIAELPVWIMLLPGDERAQVHATVSKALELLALRDPARLARIQRHIAGVVVLYGGASGAAAWQNEALGLCFVNSRLCSTSRQGSALLLALLLVHEGMHALLAAIGFSAREPLPETRRIRIERVCAKAELLVLQRLVPSPEARAPLEVALLRQLAEVSATYSDASRVQRQKAMRAELRELIRPTRVP